MDRSSDFHQTPKPKGTGQLEDGCQGSVDTLRNREEVSVEVLRQRTR
ncbi:MAG: hypothetical protein JKY65_27900 [Planctomycetes bacterium]|nr:hypothetical protein [Planctomycetota bacterium]